LIIALLGFNSAFAAAPPLVLTLAKLWLFSISVVVALVRRTLIFSEPMRKEGALVRHYKHNYMADAIRAGQVTDNSLSAAYSATHGLGTK
jgi:hypothetical protein